MQTFLPYADFIQSAQVLDKKRCWKQVVEAKQILDVLEGKSTSWKNHPAVKMWEGYTNALKIYYNAFLSASVFYHSIKTKLDYYNLPWGCMSEIMVINTITGTHPAPWWLGNEDFHRAMRSRLIEKDREFYLPKFPEDEGFNGAKYFWPVMETKTFRVI